MPDSFYKQWQETLVCRWAIIKEEAKFTRKQSIVVVVLSLLALSGGLLGAHWNRPHRVSTQSPPSKTTAIRKVSVSSEKSKKYIYVYVTGAVVKPDLYKLIAGNRTAKAIAAAGGFLPTADKEALNLAAKVNDGQKITVPKIGDPAIDVAKTAESDGQYQRVNLNTASAEQLQDLDGIGPVLAKRIIDWRRRHGRFATVSQLNNVQGIGPKKFELIKDHVSLN